MRLRHIEIIDAILRTGSLTEAAEVLYVSQPAASKLLANAESQLGYKLFERIKGRLKPTREATILAPQVARLQQELTDLRRLAYNLKHMQQGHLRVGSTPAVGLGLLPSVIQRVHESQPHITFDLHTHHSSELVTGLQARELDMVVTFDPTEHPGVKHIPIGHTELMFMSRSEPTGPISLKDLPATPFIALEARDPSGLVLQRALDDHGLKLNIMAQVQTHYVACAMVEAGCGNTIIDLITARAMLRPGLTISRLTPRLKVSVNAMVLASDPMSIQHQLLIDTLQLACREHHWREDVNYLSG
ncbi:MAG: LysR family transcriptional regulator [Burkholderiaceae bacterium]